MGFGQMIKNPDIHFYNYKQLGAAIELAGGSPMRILSEYEPFLLLLSNNNIKVHCEYVLTEEARTEIEKSLTRQSAPAIIEEVVPHDPEFKPLRAVESLKQRIKSTLAPNEPTRATSFYTEE